VCASQFVSKTGGDSEIIGRAEVEWATGAYNMLQADIRIEQRRWLNMTALIKKLQSLT
jgi:hypothetical protein